MASKEEGEEPPPRGNEWEVVSLTSSAYAALNNEHKTWEEYEGETSEAVFMSGHFVFPPSQHENLPLEPESNHATQTERGVNNMEYVSEDVKTEQFASSGFRGIPIFDENGNILPIGDAEFEKDTAQEGDFESALYSTEMPSFSRSDENSNMFEESREINFRSEPSQQESNASSLNSSKSTKENEHDDGLPCQAWWKRQTASLVAHAKEANTFWSIFVAAAVMGLVIIGQQWQQERWQILQLKLQHGLCHEKIGRMFVPLSRLKDIIVRGHNRGTFIKENSSSAARH
ncbi:unnamed protein product [Cuscuta europaea]|uniref:ATG8-interacting protein 1 n=1 Tax=Cuscuta europaea TaxID=41803 RepID=A0A9P0ZBS5_CUSEU|nr:unnamed protein product [Cuscuta europaea]